LARQIDNLPDRPSGRDLRQLARVLRFLAPYRARMAVAGVALIVAAGCVLVLGQGLKRVIDAGFAGNVIDAGSLAGASRSFSTWSGHETEGSLPQVRDNRQGNHLSGYISDV
jgi:hypothetical protein